mmetsp:Transcript_14253/g.26406  ORF Transcript_14253/g.26406 Transcript_14253/m.26406 type:complete len:264 (-) Transcript_14253:92-883(-)
MNTARPQPRLSDFEASPLTSEHGVQGHYNVLEQNFHVTLWCLFVIQRLHGTYERYSRGIHWDQEHCLLLERRSSWVSLTHQNSDFTLLCTSTRDEGFHSIDYKASICLIFLDFDADVTRVAACNLRLCHSETRSNFAIKKWLEPLGLLSFVAKSGQSLHVSSVRASAVHCEGRKLHVVCCSHNLAQLGILQVIQPSSAEPLARHLRSIIREPQVPKALLLGHLLKFAHNCRVHPLIPRQLCNGLTLLVKELLVRIDMFLHKSP